MVDAQIEFLKDDKGQVTSARHTQGGQTFVAKRLADEKELQVDEEKLDRYVGKYEYPGIGVLTVRRRRGQTHGPNDRPAGVRNLRQGAGTFFWKVVAAEIEFVVNDDGKVEKAIHQQSGATIEAKKIE